MSLTGAVVNALAIVGGGANAAWLFRRGIPERVSKTVMVGLGLCVLYIGISGASACRSILIVIVSMTLGAAVGALLNIDGSIHRLGTWVEAHVHRHEGGPSLAEGSSRRASCAASVRWRSTARSMPASAATTASCSPSR